MQGFNMGRYVPPDVEGTTSGNKLHGKHALGARASKLASSGILTVRFEMPYAIWCSTCPKPTIIGQGVRFNAEKKRVGSYHSTAIWQFRMRHADCGGWIEIRTDPQNTAYVVVSGAKKRDTGDDGDDNNKTPREGEMVIMTDEERQKLRSSAFASLEKTIQDREQLAQATERIDELEDISKKRWDDPYARNKALRKTFRAGRHQREKDAAVGEALKDKMSLGIDLVPATEEDARRARLVDFGPGDGDAGDAGHKALAKPLFSSTAPAAVDGKTKTNGKALPKGTPKAEVLASKRREDIVSEIVGNTRMARDPFLVEPKTERTPARIPGLKRKRGVEEKEEEKERERPKAIDDGRPSSAPSKALVGYDSESD
ncbi:coiled-coil domain-containing protein 130 [Colletotrichum spaethianum]|uniref:Coiled-coil domain-containing protein 130 n=1 Tax=Colletotrichum spaethianum TaxID=700344 RepID=A0AA37NWC8_9PEZI|nr:coiled-coil domain-containing protein 130 [Colletotrichum spaethianum]GKT44167.1 coiled-coil domain-containing protein 130 [Colletotrichum spaethianum]